MSVIPERLFQILDMVIWDTERCPERMIAQYGPGPFKIVGLRLHTNEALLSLRPPRHPVTVTIELKNLDRREFEGDYFKKVDQQDCPTLEDSSPKTLSELRRRGWARILRLFRHYNVVLDLAVGEEAMGQYSKIVLDGKGFWIVTGKGSFQEALCGSDMSSKLHQPLHHNKKILEKIRSCDPSVSEAEVVAKILAEMAELTAKKD